MSNFSEAYQNLLEERLKSLGRDDFTEKNKCDLCKIDPERFSLIGAIDLGLEVAAIAIKFYNDLLRSSDNAEDKRLFKRLLREKKAQRGLLKAEKKFPRTDEDKQSFIDTYCIPEVISKLWK